MPHYDPEMHYHVQLTSSPSWNCDEIDLLKLKEKKSPSSVENMLKIILKRWPTTSPCEDDRDKQPGRQALTRTLTCLVDLIAQGEAGTLPRVVWGELDIERGARRDDGRRCYVPTVFAQQVCCFAVPVSDLDEVVPVEAGEKALKPSVRETLQDAGDKTKHFFICTFHRTIFQTGSWDPVTHIYAHIYIFPFCLADYI